jgi:GTPase SAR1 family protein
MTLNYFRGAAGALAVADLTRQDTIEELHKYCDKFLTVNSSANLVIIGNKIDIFHEDQQIISELSKVAEHFSTDFLLTSAKSGERVEHAFLMLSKKIGSNS